MDFKNIAYTKKEGIATLKLNRPQVFNSLSMATWSEIGAALDAIEADNEVRVVILTGEGKAFSAGDDISEFGEIAKDPEKIKWLARMVPQAMDRIEHLKKPVIASVNGMAMGGGCELVLVSDIVVASEKARFGLPEVMIGAIAGVAVFKLPHIVGVKRAKEMLLTGDTIDAQEAYRIGMVNKVVPHDQLEAETLKMAKKISAAAPVSASVTKEMINVTSGKLDLDRSVDIGNRVMTTADFQEGFAAFMSKRPPVYKGK
ncbi:MAG: enoyl-CoA hydratase/isomerase family protein [Dehalococcoidia bacterium]|nr:enoyl-CoA hydratase/isomerase family protein [Dehalococcoidia bacterium]